MGRYCIICYCYRANERFGGRGWRRVICNQCRKLPKAVRRERLVTNEILEFLDQSNISKKNLKRLDEIQRTFEGRVVCLARLVKEIALVRSHRRKRWRYVYNLRPELLPQARFYGLIEEDEDSGGDYRGSEVDEPEPHFFWRDDDDYINELLDDAALDDPIGIGSISELIESPLHDLFLDGDR